MFIKCSDKCAQMTPFVDGRQVDLYSLYKDVEERGNTSKPSSCNSLETAGGGECCEFVF